MLETVSLVFIPFARHTQRMRLQNTTHKIDAAATRSPSFTETGIVKDKWMAGGGKMCLLTCIKGMEMIIVHNSADRWNPCKYWVSKKSRREGREAVDVRLFTTREMFSADFPILSLSPRREMSPTRWCSFPFLEKTDGGYFYFWLLRVCWSQLQPVKLKPHLLTREHLTDHRLRNVLNLLFTISSNWKAAVRGSGEHLKEICRVLYRPQRAHCSITTMRVSAGFVMLHS